jgi:hypothetical protein
MYITIKTATKTNTQIAKTAQATATSKTTEKLGWV